MAKSFTVRIVINDGAIAAELRGKEAQSKVDEVADAALVMQKSLCPVDTGKLERSLEKRKTADGMGRQVGSFTVDYALPVEYGHETRAGTWVPAQPFIRPSIDAARAVMKRGK